MAMNSPPHIRATSLKSPQGSDQRVASSQTAAIRSQSLPELSIFPAFTPDPIRLAELRGASTYSPPVSPTRGETQELFAAIGKDQAFFELLDTRGLTLDPIDEVLNEEETSDRINAVHCVDGRRRTLLHQACRCGNVQVAQSLLFHGADASARCRDGRTPFHEAVLSKGETALGLLKLLVEHDPMGISIVDANGSHVLHLAAIHGDLSVIQWCAGLTQPCGEISGVKTSPVVHLDITTVSGRNMLHYATYNSRLDVLRWVLGPDNPQRGELSLGVLDTNGYSVWHYAAMGASLQVCEWLVLEAPGRHQLNLMGRTSEGKTAVELGSARPPCIRHFLEESSKVPSVPSTLRCLGADTASLGVGWDLEPISNNARLWETLKPLYFQLEICKKPASLSRASGFLTMLMLMPQTAPGSPRAPPAVSSALMSASYLLHWEPLGVLLQPEAREHWLCGLEKDTEYLVRMRARNCNGFSGYSVPSLSGAFTTSDGGRRRSLSSLQRFFGAIKEDPPVEAIALSFIGNLQFELVEARGLPLSANSLSQSASPGCFFAAVTIETPSTPDIECSENSCSSTRVIYCVRSRLAALQQDLKLSGSSNVWRHPQFSLSTVFRAPESLAHTQVTITVNYESQGQSNSCCVGRLTMPLLDLVQGMPAKMQWLPLINVQDSELDGGLILLRTLFLPNGVPELPHPTIPDTYGRTAEELLSTSPPPSSGKSDDWGPPPGSASSTSSSSSCSSQFAHSSMLVDRLGFVVFDPEIRLRNGEWQRSKPARSYTYYKLLIETLERQQEKRWLNSRTLRRCEIRALVWRGIPLSRRPEMYVQMSGASIKRSRFPPDYYLLLIRRLEDPTNEVHSRPKNSRFAAAKKQLLVDLKRTFAGNDECWLNSAMGQHSLERLLLAYALHNDALGYCQSMTFVVGRLLCLFQSQNLKSPIEVEEQVFWLLNVICEDLFPSYYTQEMAGLQVDGGVLDRLVRMRLPKLHRHFQQLHVPPIGLVLVTQWLLPLCCTVFPSETTFRFLDVLFFEGSTVVFAMAIALLRVSQHQLLAENTDYTQLFRFLRARDQRLHDAPLLMEVAYDEHQDLADQINLLRDNVASELGIDAAKTASMRKLSSLPVDELRPGDVDIHM